MPWSPSDRLGLPRPVPGRAGDPGLFGPGSAVWYVGRERALLAGGPAALLLQLAHPLVAAAVSAHSRFRQDPFGRLNATLDAVLTITFGDRAQAERAAARVRAVHLGVRGSIPAAAGRYPAGAPYDANDPSLGLWVHATLVKTALEARAKLVGPLPCRIAERYYLEARRFAALLGVDEADQPGSYADFLDYYEGMLAGPELTVSSVSRGLAEEVLCPPLPPWMRPAGPLLRAITAGLLPDRWRRDLGLSWDRSDRARWRSAAAAMRTLVPALPGRLRYWPHYGAARARLAGAVGRACGAWQ